MKKRWFTLVLLLLTAALPVACGGGDDAPEAATVDNSAGDDGAATSGDVLPFAEQWQTDGATAMVSDELAPSLFEGATSQVYIVDGEELQVYRFPGASETDAAAATVSPDGGTINNTPVRWAAPPHFYRLDNNIILYVGNDADTLARLSLTFGPPFAGTVTAE